MPKIFTYRRCQTPYNNVHSLIRNEFKIGRHDQENSPCFSGQENAELFKVLSPSEPKSKQGLVFEEAVNESLAVEGAIVDIVCSVAFSNRGKKISKDEKDLYIEKQINEGRIKNDQIITSSGTLSDSQDYSDSYRIPKYLSESAALKKFMRMTGLCEPETARISYKEHPKCQFRGRQSVGKIKIYNAFNIYGHFIVESEELFRRALCEGVGSRRSYGFGLILAAPPEPFAVSDDF